MISPRFEWRAPSRRQIPPRPLTIVPRMREEGENERQRRSRARWPGRGWAWAGRATYYIIIITSKRHDQSPTQLFSTPHARAAILVPPVGSRVVVSGEQRPGVRSARAEAKRIGLCDFLTWAWAQHCKGDRGKTALSAALDRGSILHDPPPSSEPWSK